MNLFPNRAPSVVVTSPAHGAVMNEQEPVTLTALATDEDGSVRQLEFLSGNTMLVAVSNAPFVSTKEFIIGQHTVRARVTDNHGATTTSSPVTFEVGVVNDQFVNRRLLEGLPVTTNGSLRSATLESNEPNYGATGVVASAWWTWRSPVSGKVSLRVLELGFAPVVAVYSGEELDNLVLEARSDITGQAEALVTFSAAAQTDYNLAVAGGVAGWIYSGRYGLELLSTPSNDAFETPVSSASAPVTITGLSVGATLQTGEPLHSAERGGHSVWWQWTAPESRGYTVETVGSTFDTVLGVYTGTSLSGLSRVATNDDAGTSVFSRLNLSAVAGQSYMIAVDGYRGTSGSVTLTIRPDATPALRLLGTSPAGLGLQLSGEAGRTHRLETSTNLVHWEELQTLLLPSDAHDFVIPLNNGIPPARFFRAVLAP